jgi:hypothetical protein
MGIRKSDTSVGTTIGIKTKRTRLKGVEFPRFDFILVACKYKDSFLLQAPMKSEL